jgi:hypothetical protein
MQSCDDLPRLTAAVCLALLTRGSGPELYGKVMITHYIKYIVKNINLDVGHVSETFTSWNWTFFPRNIFGLPYGELQSLGQVKGI